MKNIRFLTFVLTIATLALSACGTPAATPKPTEPTQAATSVKVNAMPVAFLGIVESMDGDQWVISGNKVTVDPSIVRDGPFNVGDRIKVEGFANSDGSFRVSRVEAPTPQETATQPPAIDDNSNDSNVNQDSGGVNTNDDNSNAVNSNDDNSNSANTNDDHGGSVNSNDDNSNSANTNDDHGGSPNANDDNSSSANSNDNTGGGQNSNDDHGGSSNNDNSGKGGDDTGGNSNGG